VNGFSSPFFRVNKGKGLFFRVEEPGWLALLFFFFSLPSKDGLRRDIFISPWGSALAGVAFFFSFILGWMTGVDAGIFPFYLNS